MFSTKPVKIELFQIKSIFRILLETWCSFLQVFELFVNCLWIFLVVKCCVRICGYNLYILHFLFSRNISTYMFILFTGWTQIVWTVPSILQSPPYKTYCLQSRLYQQRRYLHFWTFGVLFCINCFDAFHLNFNNKRLNFILLLLFIFGITGILMLKNAWQNANLLLPLLYMPHLTLLSKLVFWSVEGGVYDFKVFFFSLEDVVLLFLNCDRKGFNLVRWSADVMSFRTTRWITWNSQFVSLRLFKEISNSCFTTSNLTCDVTLIESLLFTGR